MISEIGFAMCSIGFIVGVLGLTGYIEKKFPKYNKRIALINAIFAYIGFALVVCGILF
jgi:hypothetical protein